MVYCVFRRVLLDRYVRQRKDVRWRLSASIAEGGVRRRMFDIRMLRVRVLFERALDAAAARDAPDRDACHAMQRRRAPLRYMKGARCAVHIVVSAIRRAHTRARGAVYRCALRVAARVRAARSCRAVCVAAQ